VIHVVTVAHLSGPAVASAVVRYDAIALLEESRNLLETQSPGQPVRAGLRADNPILLRHLIRARRRDPLQSV
jgi:hypothetical protein